MEGLSKEHGERWDECYELIKEIAFAHREMRKAGEAPKHPAQELIIESIFLIMEELHVE